MSQKVGQFIISFVQIQVIEKTNINNAINIVKIEKYKKLVR